ncbi:SEL1-like repeat protein [Oceanibacterium hippocampi]|uniref:Localization factor PodJL n=1 Tax=Oceanibacterium hippocampi TaxID=745714 RepID=A0A1Y5T9M3_9PROT|nr:SEL1-like repeat protein [Oceanibacterium hippocampi]SLN59001.1 Localization factor PodJL [Oceanibacterium hippocampi]
MPKRGDPDAIRRRPFSAVLVLALAMPIGAACTALDVGAPTSDPVAVSDETTAEAEADYQRALVLIGDANGGDDGETALARATELMVRAAEGGHPAAQYFLGAAYMSGTGSERDEVRGVAWLERAAARNHARAQFLLGEAFSHGRGVAVEQDWANYWYERAARQGLPEARFMFATKLAAGIGSPPDRVRALAWMAAAAAQGHEPAITAERTLAARATPAERAGARSIRGGIANDTASGDAATRYIQVRLAALGYSPGPVDGLRGPRTNAALARFRADSGLPADKLPEAELLAALRATGR